ncbi:MAG: O-antigen ligase family protein [Chitinophagaceae bacterium]
MNTYLKKNKIPGSYTYILYLVFFTSLVFSLRAVTSVSIVAIILIAIMTNKPALPSFSRKNMRNIFLAGCTLLFLLQVLALLYTDNMQQGWTQVRVKAGLVVTPLAILCSTYINKGIRNRLLSHYSLVLAVAAFYCLFISFLHYRETNDSSFFFYHPLASPLKQHAIYFSLLIVTGLIFLIESLFKKELFFNRVFHISFVIYLSVFLFLLSSKLIISFYIFYVLYYLTQFLLKHKTNRLSIAAAVVLSISFISLIFVSSNPIRARFYDILKGDIKVVAQDKFHQGDYFNGLQFRLLQWRFVPEILTENKGWWLGVSPGDAQDLLNKKFISKNMYTGDLSKGTRGYLVYNTHNQFLETLLQNGIIGLVVLLATCFSLVWMAVQKKDRMLNFIILLLIAWLFTESAFETQYGIIIFSFFPLFISAGNTEKPTPSKFHSKFNRLHKIAW